MPTNPEGYLSDYYNRERNKIIELLGGKCAVCGENGGKLEIHHDDDKVRGSGRGRLDRLTEWKRHLRSDEPNDLALLCKDCHDDVESVGSTTEVPKSYWERYKDVSLEDYDD